MDKLALPIAAIALVLSAYAVLGSGAAAPDDLGSIASGSTEDVESLRVDVSRLRARLDRGTSMRATGSGKNLLTGRGGAKLEPSRILELETRLDTYDKRFEQIEEQAVETGKKVEHTAASFGMGSTFLHSIEGAQKTLGLDSGQRTQLKRVIDETKAELDRLYGTPDDQGKTLRELMAPMLQHSSEKDALVSMARLVEFQEQRVPGSSETYAQAETRIRTAGKQEARRLLTAEQQKKWDASEPDPLFSDFGGGGHVMIGGFHGDGASDK